MRSILALVLLPWLLGVSGCRATADPAAGGALALARVDAQLDLLHAYAAQADGEAYFALFAEDAVFYGTDATERWTLPEFRAYAEPYFAAGQGWTYVALERNLFVSPRGHTAWFDERLANEKYGEVRGSGVLVLDGGAWKIAQYNLAFPVPNELAADLVERVRGLSSPEDRP